MAHEEAADYPTKSFTHVSLGKASQHEGEVLPAVHFTFWSALGIQYSLTSAPLALGLYLSLVVGLGGSPVFVWGFLLVGVVQLTQCLAIAELASAIPHSAGPAHWAVVLAPPKFANLIGYTLGWLTVSAWICIATSTYLYLAQVTMALVEACIPEFTSAAWQRYMVYIAFSLICLALNLPKAFGWTSKAIFPTLILINLTAVYVLITLLVRASPKQSAKFVFLDIVNMSGWSSTSIVFLIGLAPALAALGLFDNVTHITDEISNPTREIPRVMFGSYFLSFITGFPMTMIYQFCNVDPISLLTPVGGQPLVQLLLNGYRMLPLTIIGISSVIVCFTMTGTIVLLSTSRLYWALASDHIVPLSKSMSKLASEDHLPVNSMLLTTVVSIALGAISIGSSTAINAVTGAAGICIMLSYIITFVLALKYGRENFNQERWLSLGKYGNPIYVMAIMWSALSMSLTVLPLYLPVTAATMNYASVVMVAIIVLAVAFWFIRGSKHA
ncbi:amino acid/polyamine transporter I [Leptodontidium sp. 2 PMI_412]|nr:amino acid/polyamine transporter I [Leptodontidium sp. 2 PMI_412]